MSRRSIGPGGAGERTAPEIQDEKKVVTVLFSDISGFTSLSEKMDPEELKDLMDAGLSRLSEEIVAFGGHIDKYIGDAIMAIFGTPVAHENDPERAVRASLAMQQTLSNYAAERGVALKMRVGINTGPALLGAMGQKRADLTAMGDTVNLAQRMESNAPIGGVLITAATARGLRDRFELEELPPLKVKGKSELINAFIVKGERISQAARAAPLVGRTHELAALDDALAETLATAHPRLVAIDSEAGLGKTRIVEEWLAHAARADDAPEVWRGKAVPFEFAPPFLPFAQMIRGWSGVAESDGPASARMKLVARLSGLFDEEVDTRADLLAYLLGSIPPDSPIRVQMESDPKGVRRRAFAIAIETLQRTAAAHPLILVFDDLQWARGPLLELIAEIARPASPARVLVLVLTRPELYREGNFATDVEGWSRLTVAPLDRSEGIALASSLLGNVRNLPEKLAGLLYDRSAGNPFYLEELVRILRDRKMIESVDGQPVFHSDRFKADEMPEGVTALLQARLDTLGADTRETLRRAAVVGRTFWDRLLQRLIPESPIDAVLDEASSADLIGLSAASEFIGNRELEFRTTLLQEVAYRSCLKKERVSAHATVASWYEEVTIDRREDYLERIAHHWLEAEKQDKAFPYLVRAADRAAGLYFTDQALLLLDRAIAIAGSKDFDVPLSERRRLLAKRGYIKRIASQYSEAKDDLDAAISDAEAVHDTKQLANFIYERSSLFSFWGKFTESLEDAVQALALAQESGDRLAEAKLNVAAGNSHFRQSRLGDAESSFSRARLIFDEIDDRRWSAIARFNLANVAASRGDLQSAIEACQEASTVFERVGDKPMLSTTLNTLGICLGATSDTERARQNFNRARALFAAIGDRNGVAMVCNNIGRLFELSSKREPAREAYDESSKIYLELNLKAEAAESILGLGRLDLAENQPSEARSRFEEALGLATQIGNPSLVAEAYIGLAQIDLAAGDCKAALDHANLARVPSDSAERSDLVGWIHLIEARSFAADGELAPAREALEKALQLGERTGESSLQTEVALALTALDSMPPGPDQSTS